MMKRIVLAMTGLLAVAPAAHADPGEVTAVSVLPGAGRAHVVIDVRGSVEVQHFTLNNPARLVIDVTGAKLRTPPASYDGENRGGILNIRYSQFRPDVVRIVLELDNLKDYDLEYADDAVRVTFGADRSFTAWSSTVAEDTWAPAAPPPPPARTALAARRPLNAALQSQQPRVTSSYDSAPIADVMAGFAELSGRSIILGKEVTGFVTAKVTDQPWDVAMKAILDGQGLAAEEDPQTGIIRVDQPSVLAARDSLEPLETRIIRLNYARAGALSQVLTSVVTKDRGRVTADTGTNSLIVTDATSRLDRYENFIRQLDVQTPQVSIQARIISVDRTDVEDIGLQYDLGDDSKSTFYNKVVARPDPSTGQDINGDMIPDVFKPYDPDAVPSIVGLGGDAIAAIGNADQKLASAALEVVATTAIGRFNVTAFLQALKQHQLADEQAEPLISTSDNQPASILVGERTPIRRVDVGAQAAQAASIQLVETGIKLNVTPHVTANRQVLMEIHAEKSSFQQVQTDLGFIFNTREATSHVLVDDGQTAVIGGLTQTEVSVTRNGIPVLMELPLVGQLFQQRTRRDTRRDLLILVTPQIVDQLSATGGP